MSLQFLKDALEDIKALIAITEQDIADILWIDAAELPEKLHTDAHRWDLLRILKMYGSDKNI